MCTFIVKLDTVVVNVSRILENIMGGLLEYPWLYPENVAIIIKSHSEETLRSSSISELSERFM